jgi:hypothetical protein
MMMVGLIITIIRSQWKNAASYLLHAGLLPCLLFNSEDGGEKFL